LPDTFARKRQQNFPVFPQRQPALGKGQHAVYAFPGFLGYALFHHHVMALFL
jgi:hypothetical protein